MIVSGGFILSIAMAAWFFVRDDPSSKGFLSYSPAGEGLKQPLTPPNPFRGLAQIFNYRNTWLLFLAPGGLVGPVLAFAGLWGVPFLKTRFGLAPAEAAASLFGLDGLLGIGRASPRRAL